MIPETYHRAYSAVRLHISPERAQIDPNSLEWVAATIALEDRQRPDYLGANVAFLRDLKPEKDLKPTRSRLKKAQKELTDIRALLLELAAEIAGEPEETEEADIDLDIREEFDSVWTDR